MKILFGLNFLRRRRIKKNRPKDNFRHFWNFWPQNSNFSARPHPWKSLSLPAKIGCLEIVPKWRKGGRIPEGVGVRQPPAPKSATALQLENWKKWWTLGYYRNVIAYHVFWSFFAFIFIMSPFYVHRQRKTWRCTFMRFEIIMGFVSAFLSETEGRRHRSASWR